MRWMAALLVLTLANAPARADVWADLGADQHAVRELELARDGVGARKAALEHDNQRLAAEIERLKSEPAGVRRDARLQELLAAQKAKSDELEQLAGEQRGRASILGGARRKLIADCDRALGQQQLPEAKRLELARLRTAQAAALAAPDPIGQPIGVARAADNPLDGPRELQDKADLLRDSGDKLRREVARLSARIDGVERRRHLRERAGAVDEDLFGESISNRRSARVASTTFGNNRGSGDAAQSPAPTAGGATGGSGGAGGAGGGPGAGSGGAGAPGPVGGGGGAGGTTGGGGVTTGGSNGGSGGTLGNTGGDATVLRNLVDPATLDELRRSDGGDDLDRQLKALRRAQGELSGLANELDRRARALSHRADELKHKK